MSNANLAVRRLRKDHQEIVEMNEREPKSTDVVQVWPQEDNFLIWHFTISGPEDSPYAGGLYHGKLTFPATFPFNAPHLVFFTPNGRFETNKDICLSITNYHPESWRPVLSVRALLMSIREHFLIDEKGPIGFVIMTAEERQDLAKKSQTGDCHCGYVAKDMLNNKSDC